MSPVDLIIGENRLNLELDHATLKTRQRELRHAFPESLGLRVHRVLDFPDRSGLLNDAVPIRCRARCGNECTQLFTPGPRRMH